MERAFVIADSRKHHGSCVAVMSLDGEKIRLSKKNSSSIPLYEAKSYGILKILDIEGLNNVPSEKYNYHTENSTYLGTIVRQSMNLEEVEEFLDSPDDIFGTDKFVPELEAQRLNESLLFVEVENVSIYLKAPYEGISKVRCDFVYNDVYYADIAVTDWVTEKRFKRNNFPYDEYYRSAWITISLGEIYQGKAYKLISGVVKLTR